MRHARLDAAGRTGTGTVPVQAWMTPRRRTVHSTAR